MGSSEFSFTQDGHRKWRPDSLFSPLLLLSVYMVMLMLSLKQMARYMAIPLPQPMDLLSLSTMLLQLPTMLLQFIMLWFTMPLFTMLLLLTMSLSPIITSPQSAPLTTPKLGASKTLSTPPMR